MKKIIMLLMAAAFTAGFTACTEETAEVRWIANTSSDLSAANTYITDIAWTSGGSENQTWSDQLTGATTQETDRKTVTELAGEADCVDFNGDAFTVNIDDSSSENVVSVSGNAATLKGGENVDLVIESVAAK